MKKLLTLLFVVIGLLIASNQAKAFSLVQSGTGDNAASTQSFTISPFGSNVTAGDMLILSVSFQTGASVSSITDNKSDTWNSLAIASSSGSANQSQLWYTFNAAGGSTSITINMNTTNIDVPIVAEEWSGVATSSAFDVQAVSIDAGEGASYNIHNTVASPSTATSSELLIVGGGTYNTCANANPTASTSYSNLICANGTSGYLNSIISQATTTSAGSYVGSYLSSAYIAGQANLAAFKAPAASGGGSSTPAVAPTDNLFFASD